MGAKFRELKVWQESMRLCEAVYAKVRQLPKEETYSLGNQLRRAVVSIPSNIAEGSGRESDRDFIHFLSMARGSVYEVDTQLELAKSLGYIEYDLELRTQLESTSRMIQGLITGLRRHPLTNDQ